MIKHRNVGTTVYFARILKQEYKGQSLIFPKRYKCFSFPIKFLLLLVSLLGSLGSLALHDLDGGGLDDTDSHGLPHVTDSEPSEGRVVSEGLDTHGLAGGQPHDGSITGLDELGVVLHGLTGTTVNLLLDLSELR